ncbi:MAG: prolipoprotein diacylglyceryl transferase [Deltaproteobacteria bacterium]|nr:prolipoprotein diacylglyceryl transferase [Deltaproteobacteria bacterium]
MLPIVLKLGSLPIYSFGLMLVLGILSGGYCLANNLEKAGYDKSLADNIVFWAALWGIIGARVFFILSYPQEFLIDPISMLFASAGFVFYGSLIFGAASIYVILRRQNIPFLQFADLASVPLLIGYAVGRLGCHLSGDGDYGVYSTLPWAVSYSLGVVPTPAGINVHPTPVYETILAFLSAFLLTRMQCSKSARLPGSFFGYYLVLSGLARFLVEFIRIEPIIAWGLTQAQIISAVLVFAGIALAVRRKAV